MPGPPGKTRSSWGPWWSQESEVLIGRRDVSCAADDPTDERRIVPPAPSVVGGNPIAGRHVEADVTIDIGRCHERDLGGAGEISHRAVGRGLDALLNDKAEGGVRRVLAELPAEGYTGTGGVSRSQRSEEQEYERDEAAHRNPFSRPRSGGRGARGGLARRGCSSVATRASVSLTSWRIISCGGERCHCVA